MTELATAIGSRRKALKLIDLSRFTWHYRSSPRSTVAQPIPQKDRAFPARINEADRAQI